MAENEVYGKLIRPKNQNDNLCLFYSLLNAVDEATKLVLCDQQDPRSEKAPEAFIQHSLMNNPDHQKDSSASQNFTHGFVAADVHHYLAHLLSSQKIRSFHWKAKKTMCLGHLLFSDYTSGKARSMSNKSYVIFGIAGSTDCRATMKSAIKKRSWSEMMDNFRNEEERRAYYYSIYWTKSKRLTGSSHGICIVFDQSSNGFIKDPAKNVTKYLTVENVIDSLIKVWMIFEVRISL